MKSFNQPRHQPLRRRPRDVTDDMRYRRRTCDSWLYQPSIHFTHTGRWLDEKRGLGGDDAKSDDEETPTPDECETESGEPLNA